MNTPNTPSEVHAIKAGHIIHDINNMGFFVSLYEFIKGKLEANSAAQALGENIQLAGLHRKLLASFSVESGVVMVNNTNTSMDSAIRDSQHVFQRTIIAIDAFTLPNDEVVAQQLQTIKSNIERMLNLTTRLAEVLGLKEVEPQFKELLHVSKEVHAVRNAFNVLLMEKNITMAVKIDSEDNTLFYTKHELEDVLYELTHNAVKYGLGNSEVVIEYSSKDGRPTLSVFSEGGQISADKLDAIFNQGERLEQHANIQGTGTGLAALKSIIEANGGTIEAVHTKTGNAFVVRF